MRFLLVAGLFVLFALSASAQDRRAVVFDVDGTLTPSVYAMSVVRTDAAAAAQVYADAGVEIIYLTARIPLFQSGVSDWLSENGFPPGRLHLTQTQADRDDHGAFKARVLDSYAAKGVVFVAAFGDSSTDFEAYAQAQIPQDRVFALKRRGTLSCKDGRWRGCYRGWTELLPVIGAGLAE